MFSSAVCFAASFEIGQVARTQPDQTQQTLKTYQLADSMDACSRNNYKTNN